VTASIVWRCIVGVVVAIVVAVGIRAFFGADDDGADHVEVESDSAALSVADAVRRAPPTAIAVRGYVYDDGSFLQLCNGLVDGDPPTCRGPSVLLRNLDIARLALVEGEVGGVDVLYSDEPVLLGGKVVGTELEVVEVLSGS